MASLLYISSSPKLAGDEPVANEEYHAISLYDQTAAQSLHNLPKSSSSSATSRHLKGDSKTLSEADRVPDLRANDMHDHLEEETEEDARRHSLTQNSMGKSLERLEEKESVLDKSFLDFEKAVAMLELSSEHLVKVLEHTRSCSSSESASVYSRDEAEDQILGPDNDSQGPAMADDVWQHLAENTMLPDSDEDDENHSDLVSWHAELPNKTPPPSLNTDTIAHESMTPENMARDNMADSAALPTGSDTSADTSQSPSFDPKDTAPTFLAPPPRSRHHGRRSPNSPSKSPTHSRPTTVYKTARSSTAQTLATCLLGPQIDIVNGTTSEIYVPDVPLQMLFLFCSSAVIERLLPGYGFPQDKLEIPDAEAERGGVIRVIRYMRRCCAPARTHTSSGEMRIPQGALSVGIETVRAYRVLGLHPDADRLERLVVGTVLNGRISDEHIDLIWNGYFTRLRETSFGEAVVWFILKEMQSNENILVEELMLLMEQEEYKELKERVRRENKIRLWRQESRDEFLGRWAMERRRTRRKTARLDRWEEGKEERREWTRLKNVEENARRFAEQEAQRSKDARSSLSKDSTGASVKSKANDGSIRTLDTGKALPKTPSPDRLHHTESTPQLHADHVRLLEHTGSGGALQETGRKPSISPPSLIVSNRFGPLLSWQGPRPAPVPKRKLSLWQRLKAVL
jgi:hypothetical protein